MPFIGFKMNNKDTRINVMPKAQEMHIVSSKDGRKLLLIQFHAFFVDFDPNKLLR